MDRVILLLMLNQEKARYIYFGIILATIFFLVYLVIKNSIVIKESRSSTKEKIRDSLINRYTFSLVIAILPPLLEIFVFKNNRIQFNYVSLYRFIYEYTFLFLLWIYELWLKKSNVAKIVINFIINKRFLMAFICFILLVLLKVNFSSIGNWDNYTNQNTNNTLLGTPRAIRSDEWLVSTPFYLSQSYSEFKATNPNLDIGNNDMNFFHAPVKDLTAFVKVDQWGYLLFGNEIGLSWQWCLKLIMMLLVYFEFGMIITNKDKGLSLLSSIWLTFSPVIMWWSIINLFAIGIGVIVLFHNYVSKCHEMSILKKGIIAYLMLVFLYNFAYYFYPAWQIPMMYLIFAYVIVDFIKYKNNLNGKDYALMGITLSASIILFAYSCISSLGAIQAIMNTKYPGARLEQGGDYNFNRLTNYFVSFFLPFSKKFQNPSEISAYICPYLSLFILLVYYLYDAIKNKNITIKIKVKNNWYFIATIIVTCIMLMWLGIKWPIFVARITGLSNSPTSRIENVFELLVVVLVIIIAEKVFNRKNKIFSKKVAFTFSLLITMIAYFIATKGIYKDIFNSDYFKLFVVLLPIIFLMSFTFLGGYKKEFIYFMILINLFSGATVNPISRGTNAITNTDIAKKARSISSKDPDAIWAGSQNVNSQYLIANGIKVINGINEYPNYNWINKIDRKHDYENVWNRYAHISIKLSDKTYFKLIQTDLYELYLNYDDIKALNIKYYYTFERIDYSKFGKFNLKEIYSDTKRNQYIYMIN